MNPISLRVQVTPLSGAHSSGSCAGQRAEVDPDLPYGHVGTEILCLLHASDLVCTLSFKTCRMISCTFPRAKELLFVFICIVWDEQVFCDKQVFFCCVISRRDSYPLFRVPPLSETIDSAKTSLLFRSPAPCAAVASCSQITVLITAIVYVQLFYSHVSLSDKTFDMHVS